LSAAGVVVNVTRAELETIERRTAAFSVQLCERLAARYAADTAAIMGARSLVAIYLANLPAYLDHERQGAPFARLSEHFRYTFPQLDGLRFTHAWAGAIDTCSRFSAFWGSAYDGRLSYSLGFTGLGVGASRFGAQVMLDLLSGERTERTGLEMVRTKPIPFPPEPIRGFGIRVTRRAIDKADRNEGRRNLWLRTLDRVGLGFDS
jgi:hypothetical protein